MKARGNGIKILAAAALAIMVAAGAVIHMAVKGESREEVNRENTSVETAAEENVRGGNSAEREKKTAHSNISLKAAAASISTVDDVDYGELTEEEINILNETLEKLDKLYAETYSGTEGSTEIADNEDEIKELEAIADEYMEKAGWFEDDFDNSEFYGDLTDAEIEELNGIFDRIDAIYAEIYGDDVSLTWEEYEARYEPFEDELNKLYDREDELAVKAGWYEERTFTMTNAEFDELDDIYDRLSEISREIYNGDFYISDAEYNRRAAAYQEELDRLNAREAELEAKLGYEDDFDIYEGLSDEDSARLKEIDAEIGEIQAKIVKGADVLTEEEYFKRYAEYEGELEKLYDEYDEIWSKKTDPAPDKGNLTDEEYAEWEALRDREGEIYDEIYGDDYYVAPEEFDKRKAKYQDELDKIETRTAELSEKAGWFETE